MEEKTVKIGSKVKVIFLDSDEVRTFKLIKQRKNYIPVSGNGAYEDLNYKEEIAVLPDIESYEISDDSELGKNLLGSRLYEKINVVSVGGNYDVLILSIYDEVDTNGNINHEA